MIVQHMALAAGHSTKDGLLIYGMSIRRNQDQDGLMTWVEGLRYGLELLFTLTADDERVAMARGMAEEQLQASLMDTTYARQQYFKNREENWYHPLNQMVMTLNDTEARII